MTTLAATRGYRRRALIPRPLPPIDRAKPPSKGSAHGQDQGEDARRGDRRRRDDADHLGMD
ncbi:MAG: hypothetical protein DI530_18310, partial [Sphingomonas sp.]